METCRPCEFWCISVDKFYRYLRRRFIVRGIVKVSCDEILLIYDDSRSIDLRKYIQKHSGDCSLPKTQNVNVNSSIFNVITFIPSWAPYTFSYIYMKIHSILLAFSYYRLGCTLVHPHKCNYINKWVHD